MGIALHIGIILVCCLALGQGAAWLVDSAARIAQRLGISELVIGLTVVAFGTSAPEFAVSLNAALRGYESVSVGNVVGSNIFNIGFILGGCALVAVIKTRQALIRRDGMFLLIITVGLSLLLLDNQLSRLEGVGMFVLLVVYLFYLFLKRAAVMEEELPTEPARWRDGLIFFGGLALIVVAGHFLVESAVVVARLLGLSEWVIAVTVVAAGTSIPEFAISLVAILKKHYGISAGNLIGSNIFNTLGVLGLAGAIRPMAVEASALSSMVALVALTLLVLIFMRTDWRISRGEGLCLVLVSLAIWVYNFAALSGA